MLLDSLSNSAEGSVFLLCCKHELFNSLLILLTQLVVVNSWRGHCTMLLQKCCSAVFQKRNLLRRKAQNYYADTELHFHCKVSI